MNAYICENCGKDSVTLISHHNITGDAGFDPLCFHIMSNTLRQLRGYCPICFGVHRHDSDCLHLKISQGLEKEMKSES